MALSSILAPVGRAILAGVNILDDLGVRDDVQKLVVRTVRDTVDNVFGTKPGEVPSQPTVPMGTWEDISVEPINPFNTSDPLLVVSQRMRTANAILFRLGARHSQTGEWVEIPRMCAIRVADEAPLKNGPAF